MKCFLLNYACSSSSFKLLSENLSVEILPTFLWKHLFLLSLFEYSRFPFLEATVAHGTHSSRDKRFGGEELNKSK